MQTVYQVFFLADLTFPQLVSKEGKFPSGISKSSSWCATNVAFSQRHSYCSWRWTNSRLSRLLPWFSLPVGPFVSPTRPLPRPGLFIWLDSPAQQATPASSEAPCDWCISIHMGFPWDEPMFTASGSSSLHCESILNCLSMMITDLLCSLKKRTPGREVGIFQRRAYSSPSVLCASLLIWSIYLYDKQGSNGSKIKFPSPKNLELLKGHLTEASPTWRCPPWLLANRITNLALRGKFSPHINHRSFVIFTPRSWCLASGSQNLECE